MRAGACQQRQSNSVARVLPGNELAGDGMALVPVAPAYELTGDGASTIKCKFVSSTSLHSMWCVCGVCSCMHSRIVRGLERR